jgi:hypothetical protein
MRCVTVCHHPKPCFDRLGVTRYERANWHHVHDKPERSAVGTVAESGTLSNAAEGRNLSRAVWSAFARDDQTCLLVALSASATMSLKRRYFRFSSPYFVAVGATVQAVRRLANEGGVLQTRRALAATRTEHLELRRAVKRAQIDWMAWTLVAAGAWLVTIAELAVATS